MVSRLASVVGAAGTLVATLANLGCCGVALLSPSAALAGIASILAPLAMRWGYEVLYISLGVTVMALGISGCRLRTAYPVIAAVAGSVALLLAFHEVWNVDVFALLVLGGSAALAGGAITDLLLRRRVSRQCLVMKELECGT